MICRSSYRVARYAGEAFVLLAPMTTVAGAQAMTERLQRALEHAGSPLRQVSLVMMQPNLEQRPELLLQRADEALYQAKAQGRNRVVCG